MPDPGVGCLVLEGVPGPRGVPDPRGGRLIPGEGAWSYGRCLVPGGLLRGVWFRGVPGPRGGA